MSAIVDKPSLDQVWHWLADVPDPEIPVISITDLGIVREVRYNGEQLVVTVTPTYSGCPATDVIAESIRDAMRAHGIADCARDDAPLSPAWTTDWLSADGEAQAARLRHRAARSGGRERAAHRPSRMRRPAPPHRPWLVPRCGSDAHRAAVGQFGSTAVQERCGAVSLCREPFEHFKCHLITMSRDAVAERRHEPVPT
jgi:ring-1,2-phenylacetyl-CoA epoxidase subunit PaaD